MTQNNLILLRLANEQLSDTKFKTAAELVEWFGAVQSQDYQGAKWGLGQRLGLSDKQIEQEFNEGKILRTHIMRPTWHFVAPQDLVWMQKLTSPRVNRIMNYYNTHLGLDKTTFDKANKIITYTLSGGKFLTRAELAKELEKNGISEKGQKLAHIVSQAELDAVICSGPRAGKQFTYALVSERTKGIKLLTPTNPLAELVRRFFQSHGPATIKDFVWWSGLTTTDAKMGIEANKLNSEVVDGKTYFFFPQTTNNERRTNNLYLLPNYDEYTIAYQDRDAFIHPDNVYYFKDQGNAAFWNAIIYKGEIIGAWKRTLGKNSVELKYKFFTKPTNEISKALKEAVGKYEKFLGTKVEVSL